MKIPALAFSVGISFLFLFLVFRPLELAFPAKRGQRFFRPAWWLDLCFFLGQHLLWASVVLWLLGPPVRPPPPPPPPSPPSHGGRKRLRSCSSATFSSTGVIAFSIASAF